MNSNLSRAGYYIVFVFITYLFVFPLTTPSTGMNSVAANFGSQVFVAFFLALMALGLYYDSLRDTNSNIITGTIVEKGKTEEKPTYYNTSLSVLESTNNPSMVIMPEFYWIRVKEDNTGKIFTFNFTKDPHFEVGQPYIGQR